MNFFVFPLIAIVLLPANKGNYIHLLNNDDIEENVVDMSPQTRKLLNRVNIFIYKRAVPSGRKSISNNFPQLPFSQSELHSILKGRELKSYLTQHEIHEIKVKEICNFIKGHYMTTDFFFDEMERINIKREVKDDIRKMVTYFDENPHLKPKILEAFRKIKQTVRVPTDIWALKTNNLAASLDASRFH